MNCINMEFRFEFDFKNKGFTENAPFARTFSVCADIFGSRGNFRFALTFLLLIIYFLVYIKKYSQN